MNNKSNALRLFYSQCNNVKLERLKAIKGFNVSLTALLEMVKNKHLKFISKEENPNNEEIDPEWFSFVKTVAKVKGTDEMNKKVGNLLCEYVKLEEEKRDNNKVIRELISLKNDITILEYPPLYLGITAVCERTFRKIPLMAIPTKVDGINLKNNDHTFRLRPIIDQFPMLNPLLFASDVDVVDRIYDIQLGNKEDLFRLFNTQSNLTEHYQKFEQEKNTDNWVDWFNACMSLITEVTKGSLAPLAEHLQSLDPKRKQWQVEVSLFKDESDLGAIKHNLQLYDFLLENLHENDFAEQTPVLERALNAFLGQKIETDKVNSDFLAKALDKDENWNYLLGHMDETKDADKPGLASRELNPLDNTQRQVAYFASKMKTGDILAVNGPPGSGKTAMLKAIIAHPWVLAAAAGDDCPITMAIGATNQSVENVIDAFPNVLSHQYDDNACEVAMITRRWLGVQGESTEIVPSNYGTYFPAPSSITNILKAEDSKKLIARVSKSKDLNVLQWANPSASVLSDPIQIDKLMSFYIRQANNYFSEDKLTEITKIIEKLRVKINENINALKKERENFKRNPSSFLSAKQLLNEQGETSIPQAAEQLKHLSLIIKNEDSTKVQKLVKDVMRETVRDNNLDDMQLGPELIKQAITILFERWLDIAFRSALFHLAARYWEGRYLLEVSNKVLIGRSRTNLEQSLRRMCMVTPCLVSTINTVPSLFKVNDIDKGPFDESYALKCIDLLIMDEAGQAQQRLALGILALAKKCITVGDVLQLQPVVPEDTFSVKDEQVSFYRNGLGDLFTEANNKNVTTTKGSMLHLMRLASRYGVTTPKTAGDGILLRGHYRCKTNIIQFCNEAVYNGDLFFLEKDKKERCNGKVAEKKKILPSFAWVNSSSKASKSGGSLYNDDEVEKILDFLEDNWNEYLCFYEAGKKLSDIIAIVTPFKAQATKIKQAIYRRVKESEDARTELVDSDADLPKTVFTQTDETKLVIGTVDSLQGAEKPIVIFSGVKGSMDGEPHFKDAPFLLNVAISRAKDSFIAFICEESYGINNEKASEKTLSEWRDYEGGTARFHRYLGHYLRHADIPDPASIDGKTKKRCKNLSKQEKVLLVIEAGGKKKGLQDCLKPLKDKEFKILVTGGSITTLDLTDNSLSFDNLVPKYKLTDNGITLISQLKTMHNEYTKIILATDDDNVGETIAWHTYHQLLRVCDDNVERAAIKAKTERVKLRAITEEEIQKQFSQPTSNPPYDKGRVSAEIIREITDNLMARKLMKIIDHGAPLEMSDEQQLEDFGSYELVVNSPVKNFTLGIGRVKIGILEYLVEQVADQLRDKQTIFRATSLNDIALKGVLSDRNGKKHYLDLVDNTDQKSVLKGILLNYKEGETCFKGCIDSWISGSIKAKHIDYENKKDLELLTQLSTLDVLIAMANIYNIRPSTTMATLQRLYEGR